MQAINEQSIKIYSNETLHKMLTDSLNSGHLCHAYLLFGQKGIGKKTIAKYISAGLLCRSSEGAKPCGECNSCRKVMANGHPDLVIVDSKAAKNSIHIDTIREIRNDAYILPNESQYKVYIIPNAENMSKGAVNALLKVLEEPPKTAVFILTAESKASVLPTILSRCIPLSLYPLSRSECVEALQELAPEKTENERLLAAEHSEGILGKALETLYDDSFTELNKIKQAVVKAILGMNEYDILRSVSQVKSSRELFLSLLQEMIDMMRKAMLVKLGSREKSADNQVNELALKLSLKNIDKLINLMDKTQGLIESNASLTILINWFSSEIMASIS